MTQVNSSRRLRLIGACAVSAGTVAIAATAAFGHIPGAGNGLAPTTNGPDLRSVSVLPYDLNDGVTEKARYCFDSALETLSATPLSSFAIQTYDTRRAMNPASVSKATDDASCLVASFASGTDIAQGTVGQVVPGAVADVSSRANDYASEPLAGSASAPRAGATTGPDLLSVAVDATNAANKLIVFTFDENIDLAPTVAYTAGNFGYYDAAGAPVAGTGAVNISGEKAIVSFGAAAGPETSTRFFVNPGAVQDRPQTVAVAPVTALSTPSSPGYLGTAASPRPTISGVQTSGPQAFKVTFSQAVQQAAAPGGFIAVSDDGTAPAAATSVGTGGDPSSLLVTFPAAVAADPTSIVRILVVPNTVTAASDGVTKNPADQASTSTPNASPGFTNGPDLLAIGVDAALNRVIWKYDEAVNSTAPPAPSAFRAIAADRSEIGSTGGVVVAENLVVANYPSTITTGVLFANPFNTVTDRTGRPNPHQSVSNTIQPGAAPPVVTPPPPAPPPAATVIKHKTFVTIKRRGKRHSGKVRSPSRTACARGRKVVLKKRGSSRRFGTAVTRRNGTYVINRRTRARGRVYVVVLARGKSVRCLQATSRRIAG